MTLDPIFAKPVIAVHAAAALAALALGAFQLLRKGRDRPHRWIGWMWMWAMAFAALSSFFIHEIRNIGLFSPIHLISIWTLLILPAAAYMARIRNVRRHRRLMLYLFWLGLVLPGLLTLLPSRILHSVLLG